MGALVLDIPKQTTVSLETRMAHLAMESSFTNNVISAFRNVVPTLASGLREAISSLSTNVDLTDDAIAVKKAFRSVEEKIPHAKFLTYGSTLVSVPEGFRGNFLEYMLFLEGISDELFRDVLQTIGEYNVVLATFISDKKSKTALADHSALFSRIADRREETVKRLSKFFPGTSNVSKQRLGDVVSRFAEIDQIVKLVEKLERSRKQQNLQEIAASVRKSTEMLEVIVKDVETNGVTDVSGNAAMNISQGAFELGKYVELVAMYRSLVEQAAVTTRKLTEQLDKIL